MESLTLRLDAYTRLPAEDRAALEQLGRGNIVQTPARRDMVREGEDPRAVRLIIRGWACRYKSLADGRRQIVGFFLPGDLCDPVSHLAQEMDYSVAAITAVQHAAIPIEDITRLIEERPGIARAFAMHQMVDSSIDREWLLNVGQRNAYERIGHLLVELFLRLRAVGLTEGIACEFPVTQNDLAEATGLTPVHVNRTLQEMRRAGLIELAHRRLIIPNLQRLMEASLFNPNYLHLDQPTPRVAA